MEVVNITPSNVDEYDDNFLNSGDYECFVKIHTPTCGFCKQLEPEWKKLEDYAQSMNGKGGYIVSIEGSVKDKFNPKFNVDGYPTLVYLNNDGSVKSEYSDGDRSFEKLKEFLLNNSPMGGGGKKKNKKSKKNKKYKKTKTRKNKRVKKSKKHKKHKKNKTKKRY
jgi:protein disulfide-isomerase A6